MKKKKLIKIIDHKLKVIADKLHHIKTGDKNIPYLRGQYASLVSLKEVLL